MDTATFAHPNATPRTLVVVGRAGRGRGAAVRHLAAALPDQAGRPAAAVRRRARSAREPPTTAGSSGRASDRRRPRRDRRRARPQRGHHRPAVARPRRPRSRSCSSEAGATTRVSVRTKPGGVDATVLTGAFGGGGHARAAGASVDGAARRARDRRSSPRRRRLVAALARAERGALVAGSGPRRHPRRRQAGRTDVARHRRAGPPAGRAPSGSGTAGRSTRSRRGVLPVFLGHATRVVEYHLGDRKAYRATVCFGASSTTDDLEGRADPGRRRGRSDARGRSRRHSRHDRHDLAAAAGLQRDQGRRPPGLRAGAGGRDRRARRRARSRSTRSTSCRGTTPTRTGPIAIVDVTCSAGHVHPGARPRPRRVARERRLSRRVDTGRVGPVHARATPSPSTRSARRGRGRPAGSCACCGPLDTGLDALPVVALTVGRGRGGRARPIRPPGRSAAGRPSTTGCATPIGARRDRRARRQAGSRRDKVFVAGRPAHASRSR